MKNFKTFLTESLNYSYKVPNKGTIQIMDFYLWTLFYGSKGVSSPRQNFFGGNTAADIIEIVNSSTKKIVDEMYENVWIAALTGIMAEFSYLGRFHYHSEFDINIADKMNNALGYIGEIPKVKKGNQWIYFVKTADGNKYLQNRIEQIMTLASIYYGKTFPSGIVEADKVMYINKSLIDDMNHICNMIVWLYEYNKYYRDIGRTSSVKNPKLIKSFEIGMKPYFPNLDKFVDFAIKCFDVKNIWIKQYGGPAWSNIAKGWQDLDKTNDFNKKISAIDHMMDLQHNTGFALNKVVEFSDDIISRLLDIKRNEEPEKLLNYSSIPSRVFYMIANYYEIKVKGDNIQQQDQISTETRLLRAYVYSDYLLRDLHDYIDIFIMSYMVKDEDIGNRAKTIGTIWSKSGMAFLKKHKSKIEKQVPFIRNIFKYGFKDGQLNDTTYYEIPRNGYNFYNRLFELLKLLFELFNSQLKSEKSFDFLSIDTLENIFKKKLEPLFVIHTN